MREVEDDAVEGGFTDKRPAAGGERQAEFRGVEGVEDARRGVGQEGGDVEGGLGVFLEEGAARFERCGCEVGAGVAGEEGEGKGEITCGGLVWCRFQW